MVDIVAIHGINMDSSRRSSMQEMWRTAMVEGLLNVRSSQAGTLTVECAFYSHEYNDGKAAGLEPDYSAHDLQPGLESELVMAIGTALDGEDAAAGQADSKVYLPGVLQRALVSIQRSDLFGGVDSLLISFVKQVSRYLSEPGFRALVHQEVSLAMAQAPRLVIGHSLGSVIAYDWLRSHDLDRWPALLTLGSPLGLEAIRRRVAGRDGLAGWPGSVNSWTNIAAQHDAVAMVKKLGPLYSPGICDLPCTNRRSSAHSALSYLGNVRTARAIDKALA
jgi:hypothetical protein